MRGKLAKHLRRAAEYLLNGEHPAVAHTTLTVEKTTANPARWMLKGAQRIRTQHQVRLDLCERKAYKALKQKYKRGLLTV